MSNDAKICVVAGSISNFVWQDLDSDGVQDSGEPGFQNVTVELLNSLGIVVATTQTDAGGFYIFDNLNSGNYSVRVTPVAGTTQTYDLDDGANPASFSTANQSAVTLNQSLDPITGDLIGVAVAGFNGIGVEDTVLVDFGYSVYDLSITKSVSNPAAVGGDLVTYTINVRNDLPSPVYAFQLADIVPSGLTSVTAISNSGTLTSNTPAGSTGTINWSLTGTGATPILAGNASLTLTYNAVVTTSGGTGSSPDASSILAYRNKAQITAMTNASGTNLYDRDSQVNNMGTDPAQDDEAVQTLLPQGTATISGTVYHDKDMSGLFNATDLPIGGVTIQLLNSTGTVLLTTQTNPDGTYSFTNLIAGEYQVRELQPTTYNNQFTNPGTLSSDTSSQDNLITSIVLVDASSSINNNFGEALADISGYVYVDPDYSGLIEAGDQVLEGITIELLDSTGSVLFTTTTNTSGYYEFLQVPAGSYTIRQTQPDKYTSIEIPDNLRPVVHGLVDTEDQNFGEALEYDLALVKTISNNNPTVGSTVTFTITITNQGQNDVDNFTVKDSPSSGLTNISNISNSGTYTSPYISWVLNGTSTAAIIKAGESLSLTYQATIADNGPYMNQADITSMTSINGLNLRDKDSVVNNLAGVVKEDDEAIIQLTVSPRLIPKPPKTGSIILTTLLIGAGSVFLLQSNLKQKLKKKFK
jgi:uncharacterized repeat protein (TIGR01451 family)